MTRQTAAPLEHLSLSPAYREAYGWVQEINEGGLLLDPPYQRGSVWTLDQRMALVESWLRGLPAGVVILSYRGTDRWQSSDPYETGHGIWACIDGKQRLTTACLWFAGEFSVPASWLPEDYVAEAEDTDDGPYVRYTGLTEKGVRFVKRRCSLMVAETKDCTTEADEARFYLLVNGGGTQQTDADMANAARVAGERESMKRTTEHAWDTNGPCAECGHPKREHHDGVCDLCGYLFASPGPHEYRRDEDA